MISDKQVAVVVAVATVVPLGAIPTAVEAMMTSALTEVVTRSTCLD